MGESCPTHWRDNMNHKIKHIVVCRICGVERIKGHETKEQKEECLKVWREKYNDCNEWCSFWRIKEV